MTHTNIHRGQVFYVNLGESDGSSVQAGIRPAVVISNEACNRFSPVISICALSSRIKKNNIPTHVFLSANETGLNRDSICLCEQPMTIARDRLLEHVTTLSDKHIEKISNALRIQLAL